MGAPLVEHFQSFLDGADLVLHWGGMRFDRQCICRLTISR